MTPPTRASNAVPRRVTGAAAAPLPLLGAARLRCGSACHRTLAPVRWGVSGASSVCTLLSRRGGDCHRGYPQFLFRGATRSCAKESGALQADVAPDACPSAVPRMHGGPRRWKEPPQQADRCHTGSRSPKALAAQLPSPGSGIGAPASGGREPRRRPSSIRGGRQVSTHLAQRNRNLVIGEVLDEPMQLLALSTHTHHYTGHSLPRGCQTTLGVVGHRLGSTPGTDGDHRSPWPANRTSLDAWHLTWWHVATLSSGTDNLTRRGWSVQLVPSDRLPPYPPGSPS